MSDVHIIKGMPGFKYLHAICGILNSNLIFTWLYHRGKRKGNTLELYPTGSLKEIPISYQDEEGLTNISTQTRKIVDLCKSEGVNSPEVSRTKKTIDQLVCQLYGLNSAEIAIIEEFVQNRKAVG